MLVNQSQVWKMWTEGKSRRQLKKEIWIRTGQCFTCVFHFLFLRASSFRQPLVRWVFVSQRFQHLAVLFFTWEKTTVCLFVSLKMFYHAFIITLEQFPISFFPRCTEWIWEKQVVKCHRPWTVWIGEDLWPQSPSNIHHILSTFAAYWPKSNI